MVATYPAARPARPNFSCGPCAKHPGWQLQNLQGAPFGRSHRAKAGKAKLKLAIDLTREVLQVPRDYRIGIIPGSDTGAVETALMVLARPARRRCVRLGILQRRLGHRHRRAIEAPNARAFVADYGEIADLATRQFRQ